MLALAGRAAKTVAPMVSRALGNPQGGSRNGLTRKVHLLDLILNFRSITCLQVVHVAKSGGVGLLTVVAGLEEAGRVRKRV